MSDQLKRQVQRTELKALIERIVSENPGIKSTALTTRVLESSFVYQDRFGSFSSDVLDEMVKEGRLTELEYVLPEKERTIRSIYFPAGTRFLR